MANVIWVDECFQVEHAIWCELNKLEKQWILSGDENQFLPIWSSYRGIEINEARLHRSRFLHQLTGGNRLVLTECRRSEKELFEYYASLILGGSRFTVPLTSLLTEARGMFTFEGPARHNLCISHSKRIKINKELNLLHKPEEGAVLLKPKILKGQLCRAQDMWVWPGLEILGCTAASKKVKNNVLYTVTAVWSDSIEITNKETISLTFEQFGQLTRLSYAQTYASVQGSEFSESLRLHDTNNCHFSRKHLFVALSRGRQKELIDVK